MTRDLDHGHQRVVSAHSPISGHRRAEVEAYLHGDGARGSSCARLQPSDRGTTRQLPNFGDDVICPQRALGVTPQGHRRRRANSSRSPRLARHVLVRRQPVAPSNARTQAGDSDGSELALDLCVGCRPLSGPSRDPPTRQGGQIARTDAVVVRGSTRRTRQRLFRLAILEHHSDDTLVGASPTYLVFDHREVKFRMWTMRFSAAER